MGTLHVETSDLRNHFLATPELTPVPENHLLDLDRDLSDDDNEASNTKTDAEEAPLRQNGPVSGHQEDEDSARIRSNSAPMQSAQDSIQPGNTQGARRLTTESSSAAAKQAVRREVLKLSASQIEELMSSPDSLPMRPESNIYPLAEAVELDSSGQIPDVDTKYATKVHLPPAVDGTANGFDGTSASQNGAARTTPRSMLLRRRPSQEPNDAASRPHLPRAISTPQSLGRHKLAEDHRVLEKHSLVNPFNDVSSSSRKRTQFDQNLPSPPESPGEIKNLPLPPFSIPTYLHLEMSSERPSPLYIHRPASSDTLYEPSRVKFDRLLNFLLLPPQLERVLFFGALTCLDAWLYTFTILPLRFFKALGVLLEWALVTIWNEVCFLGRFVYDGLGRIWHRRKHSSIQQNPTHVTLPKASSDIDANMNETNGKLETNFMQAKGVTQVAPKRATPDTFRRHRRTKSIPSLLQPNHKADLLQGLLIICSCTLLMRFDASKMYHGIRGQAAIKLYVIYNVLEVCDRLFSALGQDIVECLFSPETLERKANGRSKIIAPMWMFGLALLYTVFHAAAFFYQVITLNVAVNSYSNALLTLLMSNQFVEIKGTVFKKFEKENLFQLTCADVVERFQLWLMLLIIALRNVVELGGLSIGASDYSSPPTASATPTGGPSSPNTTSTSSNSTPFSILPDSFTLLPSPAQLQLLTPFLLVLGSEMLVDWLKHAYITKFNATSPRVYARYYDVLAKDYYTNAFGSQNLVKRLGLPVIPLSCLFIRAILQTYHMFLATNVPAPIALASAPTTSLALDDDASRTASPALAQIDHIFRNALGRSSFGGGTSIPTSFWSWGWWTGWTLDDAIALTTMVVFFAAVYLLLLAFKLVLGMCLLRVARERYRGMCERERRTKSNVNANEKPNELAREKIVDKEAKRLGGWGVVEVGEDRRETIYHEDERGLKAVRDKERKAKEKDGGKIWARDGLDRVDRYSMVAKRIW